VPHAAQTVNVLREQNLKLTCMGRTAVRPYKANMTPCKHFSD